MRGSLVRDPKNVTPTELGKQQFFDYQSKGKYKGCTTYPRNEELDDYFYVLTEGKWLFDFTTRQYQQSYGTDEWYGLNQIWEDWKGHRWMLPYILKWHKELPDWIDKEIRV